MLTSANAAAVAEQFGVDDSQVVRDHLLSHLLVVIADRFHDRVVFFGGTALARTHVPDGRLSEDLDLLAISGRPDVAREMEAALATGVRREYGTLTWEPPLNEVSGAAPAVLRSPDGIKVRVQLLEAGGYPAWPTERRTLTNRYEDVPSATLTVPTLQSFVASKTVAWCDPAAPRDLYDLRQLARIGSMTQQAAGLFARLGPTNHPPRDWMFDHSPSRQAWHAELGGQTRLTIGPDEALSVVRSAWRDATSTP